MEEKTLNDRCSVNTNKDSDTFVGIMCEAGDFSVHFPLGFVFSENEKELRREILLLINTIASTVGHKESQIKKETQEYDMTEFPIQAYMYLINDFYVRGYYVEREKQYQTAKQGRINWNRTIKTQKPYIDNNKVFYLDFVTSKSQINNNELISLIHEWCVYEAFEKMGWLFTNSMPSKPEIKFKEKLFRNVVKSKISETFNDRNRELFVNMLAIIDNNGSESTMNFRYGTNRFEYVWEKLIDRTFGISDKEKYFPKTTWLISGGKLYSNTSLEPDTIMVYKGDIYVLDAKYYKYGVTGNAWDLPESASINKQITYGEYIAETEKFKEFYGKNMTVYNAFIMPYSVKNNKWNSDKNMFYVGEAVSDWKSNDKAYERVQGIVVDVKHLMDFAARRDESEMKILSQLIVTAISG